MAASSAALDKAPASRRTTWPTSPRDDGRDQRPARGSRRPHCLRRDAGFADVIALGRQDRPHSTGCAPRARRRSPRLRFDAPSGWARTGAVRAARPERPAGSPAAGGREPAGRRRALLHSYRHPATRGDRRAGASALPGAHVSLSHEVVGTFREFERAATTGSTPRCRRCSAAISAGWCERAGEAGLRRAGDHAVERRPDRRRGRRRPRRRGRCSRGLRAGAAGAASSRDGRHRDALCLDMGGTSCDVCVVDGGERAGARAAARSPGRPLALPMLDIHTVGAGGGSIAWRDAGGALRVGPRSAGRRSRPGLLRPRRHRADRDRREPRARLSAFRRAARRRRRLDRQARASARSDGSRRRSSSTPRRCAEGIRRVANAEMIRALRVVTVERGIDPRRYALIAFGGAGAAARRADRRRARDRHGRRARGLRRARGARPCYLAAKARRAAQRPPHRRRAHRRRDRERGETARRARSRGHARARRRAAGRLRASLPGPVVRARRSRAPSRRSPASCVTRSSPSTRSATATATPSRSSSSSRSG